MSTDKIFVFRRLGALARWARGVIKATIVADFALASALVWQFAVLDRIGHGAFANREEMLSAASFSDGMVAFVALCVTAVAVVNIVVFLIWTYRTNANAQALTGSGLSLGPGEAVGSVFVPLVNLVVPAMNYSEVWRASRDPETWREQRTPWQVPVWWAGNVVIGVSGMVIGFLLDPGKTVSALLSFTALRIAYYFVCIGVRVLQFVVVSRICRFQESQISSS